MICIRSTGKIQEAWFPDHYLTGLYNHTCFLLCFEIMASKKTRQPTRKTDAERSRTKRFFYLWVPLICLVIIGVYASALDSPKPTGKVMKGSVLEIKRSSQQPGSLLYKVRLESGEDIEIPVPEKEKPSGSEVMVEEYSTTFFKKKSYEIQKSQGSVEPEIKSKNKDTGPRPAPG